MGKLHKIRREILKNPQAWAGKGCSYTKYDRKYSRKPEPSTSYYYNCYSHKRFIAKVLRELKLRVIY